MNCDDCRRAMNRWLMDALEEAPERCAAVPPRDVVEHAQACSECASPLDAALLLLDGESLRPQPPADLSSRVMDRIRATGESSDTGRTHGDGAGRPSVRGPLRVLQYAAILLMALGGMLLIGRQVAQPGAEPDTMIVEFRLEAPDAHQVAVVGDWNGWDPELQLLEDPEGDGVWRTTITLRRGREYQYQFLVNDEVWLPDPSTPIQVDDGFGGTNSVLNI